MKVRLISHASVITSGPDTKVWCDPWLFGKAFNDSWSLHPPAAWREEWLEGVDFLWLSHEHPDHLHFPTLRSLPEAFKQRVTVLYQGRAPDEVRTALKRAGFPRFRTLPHRRFVSLTPRTRVYAYHAPYGDSCLAVVGGDRVCLNVNDAQIDASDCAHLRADLGRVDVLLKQFSLAGYTGGKEYDGQLPGMAASILTHMVDVHRRLGAEVTIPFASFVYFSTSDNRYVNAYANRPADAFRHLVEAGCGAALLYPGDELDTEVPHDFAPALARFAEAARDFELLPIDEPPLVPLEELRKGFADFCADIHDKFPPKRIDVLPPVHIRVPDLGRTLAMSIPERTLRDIGGVDLPAHLEVRSQALRFAFGNRYGFETMTISSRVFVLDDVDWPWILNRDLLWLYRWRIWLAPKWLLSPGNLLRVLPWARERNLNARGVARWATRRLRGGLSSLRRRFAG